MHRSIRLTMVGMTCALLTAAMPERTAAQPADPPPQPADGELGGEGPCVVPADLNRMSTHVTVVANRRHPGERVWVVRPSGDGAPRTGGACDDDRRPIAVVIHGWPANQLVAVPTQPSLYAGLIRDLVSNGNIVVFPTYDWTKVLNLTPPIDLATLVSNVNVIAATVAEGVEQVVDASTRMDKGHIGLFGHSLGGGVATTAFNMIVGARPDWGASSRWLTLMAATDLFFHCNGIPNPFSPPAGFDYEANCVDLAVPPDGTRMLYLTPLGDSPTIHLAMWRLYEDMPVPAERKWGVILQNDCSHSQGLHCVNASGEEAPYQQCPAEPAAARECAAGHLLPTSFSDRMGYPARTENHLNYFGLYRNVQALIDCARSSESPSCSADRTFMGVWSDGVAATPAEIYP